MTCAAMQARVGARALRWSILFPAKLHAANSTSRVDATSSFVSCAAVIPVSLAALGARSARLSSPPLSVRLMLLVALGACVDTREGVSDPFAASMPMPPGGDTGGSSVLPGFVDPALPGSSPRPVADCSDYPNVGGALDIPPPSDSDPVALAPAQTTPGPYRWENVTIKGGGFVTGVVFGAAAPNVIYARTDVGGAYRYDVSRARWRAMTDWVGADESNLMGIESIAADPLDSSKVYLAAGTYLGSGDGLILRSADHGESFDRHAIGVPMGGNVDGRSMGERLAVDPNQTSTLYFGSRNDGLLVSHDSAVSWQAVSSFPVLGALNLGMSFVLIDPRGGAPDRPSPTVYVGVSRLAADDAAGIAADGNDSRNPVDALWRSRDAGQSWQAVPGQPTELMPHHAALDAVGHLYLSYGDRPGPNDIRRGAVYRLDTATDGWANVSPPRPSSQRGGFAGVSVAGDAPGVVMVSTLDVWPDEIYRSTSAGECWTAIGPRAQRDLRGAQWVRFGGDSPSATGWMGDIEIDPFNPNRVLYVTGQGIWWSDDVGAADVAEPTHWAFQNDGLEETVALGLVSPPEGARLLSAVGDIAGFRHDDLATSPPNGMFDNPRFGNTTSLDFAQSAPSIVVRSGTHDARRGALSSDGGSTWMPFASEPPGGTGEGAIAVSSDGARIVWDPRGTGPHFSTDGGATWTASTGVNPPDGNTGAVVSDRVDPLLFYAREGSTVFVSRDGGATFAAAGSYTVQGGGGGARLRAVFGNGGHLWVSSNGGLWRSTDAAATFERIVAANAAPAIGFGSAAPGATYPAVYLSGSVGDQSGLYRSDDGGATWLAIHDSRSRFGFINHVSGDPRQYGRVYLGTGGRGIILGDPIEAP
jgi:xyloglucan-specific exo-beta-1,4-glucanase